MKLTILVDNYVQNKFLVYGQPGFSCYVEEGDSRLLFDLGYSKVPFDNAEKLGINLGKANAVALSHGHLDHSWGLGTYMRRYRPSKGVAFVCHPHALEGKRHGKENIGIRVDRETIRETFTLVETARPYSLSDDLLFLGQIERGLDFEGRTALGERREGGGYVPDYLLDDSALAYRGRDGLVIVTGCSHSGICNIIEQAKRVTGVGRIQAVVGGLHLQSEEPSEDFERTLAHLARQDIGVFYPCHCTNLWSKMEIGKRVRVGEIGAGTALQFA